MQLALRIDVDIVAVCILILLTQNKRHTAKNMLDDHLYQILLWTTLLYAIADAVAWGLDGTKNRGMIIPLYIVNILCYLCCVIVPYIYSLFAEFRLYQDEDALKRKNYFLAPPVIIYSILVIVTPLTGWMFSFDDSNKYQRGFLFVLQAVLSLVYLVYPTVRALKRLHSTKRGIERNECINIAGFVFFPIIGLVIQVLFYGMPAAIIMTVLGELMIFINIQNRRISLDALTLLNNRGHLNRFLAIQIKKEYRAKGLYLLVLDIDRFKLINDNYGHAVGDQAIIDMANVLKKVCGQQGGFLSRCGGDEFAIVIEKETEEEICNLMDCIQREVKEFNDKSDRIYKLEISAGYAKYGTPDTHTIDNLMEVADDKMYQMKRKRHTGYERHK